MSEVQIQLPPKLIPVFSGDRRIRGAHGGRGSGKTFSFALMSAVRAYMAAENGQTGVILCAREWMNSLKDSSMAEVKGAIESVPWLAAYFDIGQEYIRTKNKKVEYIFTGLNRNLDSLKSKARILIAWVDEAEGVSELAWDKLEPTVRGNSSEIWITWNPELDGSPTDLRYRKGKTELEGDSLVVEVNYNDNPWFPDVLDNLRKRQQKTLDPNRYAWIWEGAYLENSDKQIFGGKYQTNTIDVSGLDPILGMDFGFAMDPTTAVECYVIGDVLYIDKDCGMVGLELDETAEFVLNHIPSASNHVVRADSARPESISYLSRHGLSMIEGVKKGPNSVEEGVQFMKSFSKIVVNPRCKETLKEFRMYSYKVHKQTGDILPDIEDKYNHYMDAIRYALEPMMKASDGFFDMDW